MLLQHVPDAIEVEWCVDHATYHATQTGARKYSWHAENYTVVGQQAVRHLPAI